MDFPLVHRTVKTNNINMHIAVQGEGPCVVLCHGFPGLWYSWRYQLPIIANAGFKAVAVDQRGYGQSDRPTATQAYNSEQTTADMIGLLDALGEKKAVFIGHDFGAAQVYNLAVRYPDRVAAVIGVSCPYDFDLAGRGCAGASTVADVSYDRAFARPDKKPSECFAEIAQHHFYHMHYYQTVGPAEKELGNQVELFLKRLFWTLSAKGKLLDWTTFPSEGTGYLDVLADPELALPWPWMSKQDLKYYAKEFKRGGPDTAFVGGINAYRVADSNWEIGRQYADAVIKQPSLFIAGSNDPVLQMIGDQAMALFKSRSPDLKGIELIPEAGHFVQQEQPDAFNKSVLSFLASLKNA
jgi:epoxide hydrolase A/B